MASVIIIGDVILDVNYNGTANRIAQEACIPVVNVHNENITYSLGGAANVYNNLVNMGVNAQMITVTGGTDLFAFYIENKLEEVSAREKLMRNELFKDDSRCATVKHRFYVNNKIVFRYDTEDTKDISTALENEMINKFKEICGECKIVILSDYNKGVLTPRLTQEIISIANEKNIYVFVDPKISNMTKYKNCFMIKPNKSEGEQICGHPITKGNMRDSMQEICNKTGSETCLLTLSEDGIAILFYENFYHFPSIQHDVIDITGAGDVVLAGYVYHFLNTCDLIESTKFSNYCGQLKVKNFGTYVVTKYDILNYKKMYCSKLILDEDIESTIEILKKSNKKLIFTNGCFDILHFGHLTFLEEAKSIGDVLIVALNSDTSVKSNKGDNRPINKLEFRIKQISALKCVDFVVVFDEKTPTEILKRIRPNILVKGGDYKLENIIGREYVEEVRRLPYMDGFSTTRIINMIESTTEIANDNVQH